VMAPVASLRDGKDGGIRQAFINQARRAAMPRLRQHNGAQRRLLQMHELRHHKRVLIRKETRVPED